MPSQVIAQIGNTSQVGLATESTFGTFVTPDSLLPFSECTISPDPGLFYPEAIIGYRDDYVWPMYGQNKFAGALGGALFPSNGSPLLAASIGSDNQEYYGITGSTPLQSTTLSANSLAGATTITITTVGTDYVVGAIVQVDVNSVIGLTTSECRKIQSIATNTLTLDKALTFAHANSAPVSVVSAPFTHTMNTGPSLGSMSVQNRIGVTQAQQWAGTKVNKWALKAQATNTAVDFTADVVAQNVEVNASPTAVGVVDETPFEWVGLTLEYNSLVVDQANNLNFSIDNKLVEDYTFAQSHNVQYLTASGLIVTGSFEVIYNSLNDADWGYFDQILAEASAPLSLTFVSGTNTLTFTMPKVNLQHYKDTEKMNGVVMTTLNFECALSLEATPISTLQTTLANAQYLPF